MAKWKVDELRKELFDKYVVEFEEYEKTLQNIAKTTMVDPEVVDEAMKKVKTISNYIQSLNSLLYMASENFKEFHQACNSQLFMKRSLFNTIKEIKEQEPDSELIDLYCKKINEIEPMVEMFIWVKEVLGLPKAKKRYKAWKLRNLGIINEPFKPLLNLSLQLQALKEFIDQEF